jgi:predicted transcriptional regulator
MPKNWNTHLSRRERQTLEILYARGSATAAEVREALPDPPTYSAVRALLRVLEQKDLVTHYEDGPRYVFKPKVGHAKASASALKQMVKTFFEGSTTRAVAALLDLEADKLSATELSELEQLIEKAKQEGR